MATAWRLVVRGRLVIPPAAVALTRRGVRRWRHGRPGGPHEQRILFTGNADDNDGNRGRPLLLQSWYSTLRVQFWNFFFIAPFCIDDVRLVAERIATHSKNISSSTTDGHNIKMTEDYFWGEHMNLY